MKMKVFACIVGFALTVLFCTLPLAEDNSVELVEDDCVKCHLKEVQKVDEQGALHKTEVGCIDCHEEHPPSEEGVIPACALCHGPEDATHYNLEGNCASCHHPHYPTEIDFSQIDDVRPACLSCHPGQGREMEAHPSEHAGLDCKECHLEHGESAACMECHEPHTEAMTPQDCLRCHKPHMPLGVTYAEDIPSSFCSGCHNSEGKALTRTQTRHHELGCTYCHKNEHKAEIQCGTCHGEPHNENIHVRYPHCLTCHEDAHALCTSLNVDKMAEDCTTCHTDQATEVDTYPSAHANVSCAECHYDIHGYIPTCTECHEEPHTHYVDDAGCIVCHQPHSPSEVNYSADTPNNICAGCHDDVSHRLLSSDKGHGFLQCVFCHADKHRYVPTCQNCHENGPHRKEMLKQFAGCRDCHGDAHMLILQND